MEGGLPRRGANGGHASILCIPWVHGKRGLRRSARELLGVSAVPVSFLLNFFSLFSVGNRGGVSVFFH